MPNWSVGEPIFVRASLSRNGWVEGVISKVGRTYAYYLTSDKSEFCCPKEKLENDPVFFDARRYILKVKESVVRRELRAHASGFNPPPLTEAQIDGLMDIFELSLPGGLDASI